MDKKIKTINLDISQKLHADISAYLFQIENSNTDKTSDFNKFVIEAIVEKYNNENDIFSGEIDENGFTDGRSAVEHYLDY